MFPSPCPRLDRFSRLLAASPWHLLAAVAVFACALLGGPTDAEANGRWKWNGAQCVFDQNDTGPDQCTPGQNPTPTGRWKWQGDRCEWDANDAGPDQCIPSAPTGSHLGAGQYLLPGGSITSSSGRYQLTNTWDGWLELAEHGFPIWALGPFGAGTLAMQHDGNLVFYEGGTPMWHTGTWTSPGASLSLQNDGNLVLYGPGGNPLWASDTAAPVAPAGQLLRGGELSVDSELVSPNGLYRLRNQSDGNLVLYQGVLPLWSTGTGNAGPVHVQYDGNFVLYRAGGAAPWHANTWGHPGAYVELQNDGNLTVKSSAGGMLWQTGTGTPQPTTPRITINTVHDPNAEVTVRVGQALNVYVEGVPAGPGFTVELHPANQCCDGPYQLHELTQRPQGFTFTAPATVGWYDVSLVYCCPDPYPETSAERAIVVGPRIHVLASGYLTLNGAGDDQPVTVRPNHPLTVQVHNASNGTDRVGWFRVLNGQVASQLFTSKAINGDLNAAVPFDAPDAPDSGIFALRLITASGQVLGGGPRVTVPGVKLALKPASLSVETYDPVTVAPGETVRVTVVNPNGLPSDWVGLYSVGGNTLHGSPQALDGTPDGTYDGSPLFYRTFTIPETPGHYEIRFVAGDTGIRLSRSNQIIVPAPPPTLTINGTGTGGTVLVRPNHPVGVQVSHAPGGSDRVVWIRLSNGQQLFSASVNGNPNALVPFTAPDAPASGLFEVRLLGPNNTVRAVGPTVDVPGNKLPLKPDHSAVDLYDDFDASPMESVRVMVADIGAQQSDWLGLFRVGTPDNGVALQVQTLTGSPSTTGPDYGIYYRFFSVPPLTGQYEIRLFAGDTGIRIARSNKIRVQGAPEAPTTLTINTRRLGDPNVPLGPNGVLQVVVAGNPLYATDRVEIWAAGAEIPVVPPRYLNGQTTPPASPPVEGNFTMTGPAAPGLYVTVVLRNGENPNAPARPAAYGPSLQVGTTTLSGTDTQFYYSADAIGSIRVITNAAGSVEARKDYLPFGSEWNSTSTSQGDRLGFVGKERDPETGLDYLGARYHASQTGRFTTVDPGHVNGNIFDPQSWNAYAYARNNPLKYTDPTGTEYEICADGDQSDSCGSVSDQYFAILSRNPGAGIRLSGGAIFAGNKIVGHYRQTSIDPTLDSFIRQTGALADRWLREQSTQMAVGAAIAVTGGFAAGAFGGGLAAEGLSVTGRLAPLKYGKQAGKFARQMAARGWTDDMIREAVAAGQKVQTINKATGNPAIRFVHPRTGQSVVIDMITKEIIHVGGPGFLY